MFGQGFNSGFFKAPCFTDTTDIFKDNSGIALYTLDYDASDSGGATGKYREGAVFNGTSSQIDTTATLIPNSTDFSLSFWINPDNQFGSILARGLVTSGANAWGFDVSFNNSANKLRFFRHTGGAYANEHYAETATNSITVGIWQHIVLSFDKSAGAPQFYINGSAATTNIVTYAGGTGSAMATGNIAFNSSYDGGRYRLGNRSNGGLSTSRLKGTLDHFRVFNKVVSASEVTTLYSDATDTIQVLGDTSCTAFYNFNNNALDLAGSHDPNSVSDIIYKYDGTPTAVDFGVGGKSLYGARFNGSTSDIIINNPPNFIQSGQVGISMWVNIADISARKMIIAKYGSGNNREWRINLYDGTLSAVLHYNGNNSNSIAVTAASYLTNNTWHHLAYSVNGTSAPILYIDGVSVGTAQYQSGDQVGYPTSSEVTSPDPIRIGETISSSFTNFEGKIDQVRFFNRSISATEVSKLYGNGAGEIACKYTATTTDVNYPVTNTAYYKLDNSAVDETGSYSGTESNIEYKFGRYGQAAVFNGSSSKIVLPNSSLGITDASNFSFSCWFKTNSSSQDNQALIWTNGSNAGARLGLGINSTSQGGDTSVYFGVGTSSFTYINSGTGAFTANTWVHVVGVKSSTTGMSLYVDNVLKATNTGATGAASATATGDNRLGGYKTTAESSWFNGSIDQVRLFPSALSSDQVTKLYNEKPETDTSNFKTVLYTGNSSTQYISNVGFQPDLVWIKSRTVGYNHRLFDSVRTLNGRIESNTTAAEVSNTVNDNFTSFDANGFTLGATSSSDNGSNKSGANFVAWCWKGGGDAVQNNDGTIQGANCLVSANTEAGFSIVKYTGNGAAGATVGHGLGTPPDLIIVKLLDTSNDWYVFSELLGQSGGEYQYLELNDTPAANTFNTQQVWNGVLPTSDVFTLTGGSADNLNNNDYIAYCFASVSGYSKIGTYSGSGVSGKEVTLDFSPSFVLIKRTNATAGWVIVDDKRGTKELYPHLANQEDTSTTNIVLGTNKFTLNSTGSWYNASGGAYLYMAFK